MVLLKLAFSNFATRKVRAALTVCAIALSVSLVVSVTSGYASVESAVFKYLGQYLGATDVIITRKSGGTISEALLAELRRDRDVRKVDARLDIATQVASVLPVPVEAGQPDRSQFNSNVIGIRRPDDKNSDFLKVLNGGWFNVPRGNVAVIDQGIAERLKLEVGGEIVLPGTGQGSEPIKVAPQTQPVVPVGLRLKVVGIIHKPAIIVLGAKTVYVPIETLQAFAGKPGEYNSVLVDTRADADMDKFEARWTRRLAEVDKNLKLRTPRETRKEMDRNFEGVHALSYLGGTISMLAATFIVFSALSMGVSERQRTLAMLRAVGAQRGQVGALVILEGVMLSAVGAAIGVPLGWAWIKSLSIIYSDFFLAGVVLSKGGILLGTAGSIGAALAASLLPAWSATRVSPLEAMNPLAAPTTARAPWVAALFGLVLIGVDPFLLFGPIDQIVAAFKVEDPGRLARDIRFFSHFGLGLPCLIFGFFLLSPMFVWVTERLLGRIVAGMFGLRFALLRQQLSSGVWRVAGTCSALMVGLAVLVVMQVSGNTLLHGWRLPDKFPDVFITTGYRGLNWDEQAKLAEVPGIRKGEVMPIAIASPEFGSNLFAIAMASWIPDATMFIAVPPDKAFRMMELEFKEGNADNAAKLLAQGDHIVVTEEFRQLKGLGLGGKLSLKTRLGTRDFTIAGVVWSPGMDVMVSMYDLGQQFEQRTVASVFGSLEDGRKYFGIEQVMLFAANLDYFVERDDILKRVQKELGKEGMSVGDVRHIKANIQEGFLRLLLLVSTVAFAAMGVASLGVTNTIMASIRSRAWQFGILRSIGVTRSQLMRLVLAEAFLIGLVGCALGLVAGALMSMDATQLTKVIAGYAPPIWIPWRMIWLGTGIVMAMAVLASVWPAISVARREPLSLLQAGRAAG
jgi:putative ABC transport system permease protein